MFVIRIEPDTLWPPKLYNMFGEYVNFYLSICEILLVPVELQSEGHEGRPWRTVSYFVDICLAQRPTYEARGPGDCVYALVS